METDIEYRARLAGMTEAEAIAIADDEADLYDKGQPHLDPEDRVLVPWDLVALETDY